MAMGALGCEPLAGGNKPLDAALLPAQLCLSFSSVLSRSSTPSPHDHIVSRPAFPTIETEASEVRRCFAILMRKLLI